MTITNGQLANADEVMNAMGLIFSDSANLIWNADLIGFDSNLNQDFDNITYDTLQDSTGIDSTNSVYKHIPIVGGDIFDDFEDNSINTAIWSTTGTVTETGGKLVVGGSTGTHTATADGASTTDFNNESYRAILQSNVVSVNTGGGTITAELKLVDQSANEVSLTGLPDGDNNVRCDFEPGTNNVQVYLNDPTASGAGTAKDVTSLTNGDAWHLKLRAYGQFAGDAVTISAEYILEVNNAVTNNDFISSLATAASTVTNAILAVSEELEGSSTISYLLSADNGSNYEAVTPNQIHRFTNTGTQLKLKATMNTTATEIPQLHHYAIKYNFF